MGYDREATRAALDCRELARVYGVTIKGRRQGSLQACCPNGGAHKNGDRNPSLSITKERFYCFTPSCGISGDVFDWIALHEDLDPHSDFPQVLEIAAAHAGLAPDAPRPHTTSPRRAPKQAPQPVWHPEPLHALYELVKDEDLGPASKAWCKRRGIDAQIAWEAGCRDFGHIRGLAARLRKEMPGEELAAAGLLRRDESGWTEWAGLRASRGETWAAGLTLPVWVPEYPFPVAWRQRLANPITFANGKTLKACSPYASRYCSTPLGWPETKNRDVVLVVEGEPDWLSALEATRGLNVGVMGYVAMSRARFGHASWLSEAKHIICMVDDGGGGGKQMMAKMRASMMRHYHQTSNPSISAALALAYARIIDRIQPDAHDLNDLHRQGALGPMLEDLLGHLGPGDTPLGLKPPNATPHQRPRAV